MRVHDFFLFHRGTIRSVLLSSACLLGVSTTLVGDPAWWAERGVMNGEAQNNFGPVNIGQAKWMVTQAHAEMEAKVPGGAGFDLTDLFPAPPQNPDQAWYDAQKKPLNIGQLKALSTPFFDRLHALDSAWLTNQMQINGIKSPYGQDFPWYADQKYPWDADTPVAENFKPANIGQLKAMFSFDFPSLDTDSDGLLDSWEMALINANPNDPYETLADVTPSADPDGDSVTNAQEYENGTDPLEGELTWQSVEWTRVQGAVATASTDGQSSSLTKNIGTNWNSGASSTKVMAGDGELQFKFASNTKYAICGLSEGDLSVGRYESAHGFYATNYGPVLIMEKGQWKVNLGNYTVNDLFAIKRINGVVTYYKNGQLVYTSKRSSGRPLFVDAALYHSGAGLTECKALGLLNLDTDQDSLVDSWEWQFKQIWSFEGITKANYLSAVKPAQNADGDAHSNATEHLQGTSPINTPLEGWRNANIWNNLRNSQTGTVVESLYPATGNAVSSYMQLTKNSGVNNTWDADATSSDYLPGDGGVSARAGSMTMKAMFGLNLSNDSASYTDLDYAIYFNNGQIHVYENGVLKTNASPYGLNESYAVERDGDTIHYKRNGQVFYTSATKTTAPLLADCSLYSNPSSLTHCVTRGFPYSGDLDNDGLTYDQEYVMLSAMTKVQGETIADITGDGDTDGDGISNVDEITAGTDPVSIYSGEGVVTWPTDALIAWYRTDEGDVLTDANGVLEWKNSLSDNYHMIVPDSNHRPQVVAGAFNGHDSVRVGESKRLTIPSSGDDMLTSETTGFTILGSFKTNEAASRASAGILSNETYGAVSGSGFRFGVVTYSNGGLRWWATQSGGELSIGTKNKTPEYDKHYQFSMSHDPSPNGYTVLSTDGEIQEAVQDKIIKTNTNNIYLSHINGETGQPGEWGELMIAKRKLTIAEETMLQDYQRGKLQGVGPLAGDTNGNGIPDWKDIEGIGLAPLNPDATAPTGDPDNDGLINSAEASNGTDPFNPDTDNDGLLDGNEVLQGANPLYKDHPAIQLQVLPQ